MEDEQTLPFLVNADINLAHGDALLPSVPRFRRPLGISQEEWREVDGLLFLKAWIISERERIAELAQAEANAHASYRYEYLRWQTCCGHVTSFECYAHGTQKGDHIEERQCWRTIIRERRCPCGCHYYIDLHLPRWMLCCESEDGVTCAAQKGYEKTPQWVNPLHAHRDCSVRDNRCLCLCHDDTTHKPIMSEDEYVQAVMKIYR